MANGISSTMVTMDGVMGAANRAEPTIRSLDIRNDVMEGWCIEDQNRMKPGFVSWSTILIAAFCTCLVFGHANSLVTPYRPAMYRTRFFAYEQFPLPSC